MERRDMDGDLLKAITTAVVGVGAGVAFHMGISNPAESYEALRMTAWAATNVTHPSQLIYGARDLGQYIFKD